MVVNANVRQTTQVRTIRETTMPANADLRNFIVAHFSDADLDLLIADYFAAYTASEPSGLGLSLRAQKLIEYCGRMSQRTELEQALEKERPALYRLEFGGAAQTPTSNTSKGPSEPTGTINTGGGPTFTGPINVDGDFVLGNKTTHNYAPGSSTGAAASDARNGRIRILLCTATDKEDDTLLDVIERNGYTKEPITLSKGTYRGLGQIGNADVFWVRSGMGGSGSSGALATTLDAIDELKPDYVIACGLTFGADEAKQKLGDVLVSEWVQAYEKGKAKPGEFIPRGAKTMADNLLLQAARSARLDARDLKVIVGGLLSGEKLVDDPAFKAALWKREPEAVGGEMEASGIVDAASRRVVRWLIVKAICDWGENKKNDAQSMAALNAMRFVFAMIGGKLIPRP